MGYIHEMCGFVYYKINTLHLGEILSNIIRKRL
nr:MAG TPA: hypothetical protein [Crassvirales sp.]DAU07221.1 MAG TPA: hypothetical protein [Caudoviricetes sp.]DAX10824.1 MAG TPA: hypothetical protein [Bacteriophage sp.]